MKSSLTGNGDDSGASAVEYGLLIAGVAAIIVAIVLVLGGNVKAGLYEKTAACIDKGADSDC